MGAPQLDKLFDRIRTLPAKKVAEISRFVDSIDGHGEDEQYTDTMLKLSKESFSEIWDNDEDAIYDEL